MSNGNRELTSLSSQINLSRDQIRTQIIDYLRQHLELDNVDLTKSSFLSYLVNIFSTLTSNLLFYQSSVYKEFFLTKAQLPESIYNLSAFIGYTPQTARPSKVDVLMTIPFGFSSSDITFTFNQGFEFYSDNITFTLPYDVIINVKNNTDVSVTVREEKELETGTTTIRRDIPVTIDEEDNTFSFLATIEQVSEIVDEYQIDTDLKVYQFTDINVAIDGKLAGLVVEVKPSDSDSWVTYDEYSSLYLMDDETYGYTYQRTEDGVRIFFGNNLMGIQPPPGSTVRVTKRITMGSDGNVIPGAITQGQRKYVTDSAQRQPLNYSVVNPYAGAGGVDEESLEQIRNSAITNLVSMRRLVSKYDYENFDKSVLIEEILRAAPIINSIYPVLKRSDIKSNEISLFITFIYNNELVKTRSIYKELPESETMIPSGTVLDFDGIEYYTLYNMYLDLMNKSASYEYVVKSFNVTPALIRSYETEYDITATNLNIDRSEDVVDFNLSYQTSESDFDEAQCKMVIRELGETYDMINDSDNKKFSISVPFDDIPSGDFTYRFIIESPLANLVNEYSVNMTLIWDASGYMRSQIVQQEDSTAVIVYDIPVVEKEYYDNINQEDLESYVEQGIITLSEHLDNYRMITDFVNLKTTNTTGKIYSMLNNPPTLRGVIDIVDELPSDPDLGDRYILKETNEIVECTSAEEPLYLYLQPSTNDFVYIFNRDMKYIFTGNNWIYPVYDIPLEIEIEVGQPIGSTTDAEALIAQIKTKLLNDFSDRFGPNSNIYRSEIIRSVQELASVQTCTLYKPESDIMIENETRQLTQKELLEFVPDHIYFTNDTITVLLI